MDIPKLRVPCHEDSISGPRRRIPRVTGTDKPSVIITGAGSGTGRGIARAFVEAGYEVFASDISQERLEETKAELSSPSSLHLRVVDVSRDRPTCTSPPRPRPGRSERFRPSRRAR
ncbi:SDR family NAD(P)-dependent oxidoreductase [Streptomyces sp. NBC_01314]|uniref:SDR family NAD(P)-dependent oxidoreductase n=1 Tax=Streptomyces sp. NBC_01314 TaxID=2903821 RepID=UPI00352F277A